MIRLALALSLLASTADARTIRIHDNGGGSFNDYAARVPLMEATIIAQAAEIARLRAATVLQAENGRDW